MVKVHSRAASYSVALLAAGFGLAVPLITKPFFGMSAPFVSFIPAVLLSAWYGGLIPGLVTTGLLLAASIPLNEILFMDNTVPAAKRFGAVMFAVVAPSVCLVIRALRRAQTAALDAATAARAAETRAQAERDRLDVILRDLPVGVLIVTEDRATGVRKVERANPAAMEIFGALIRSGDLLLAHKPHSIRAATGKKLEPGDWPVERSLGQHQTVVNEEIDIIRPDGQTRTVMINARPLEGSSGRASAAIATYADVTSLRAAQKALRASEARLRRLFDSPIIGVASGDEHTVIDANDGFLRMLGYSRDDLKQGRITNTALSVPAFQAAADRIAAQLTERGFSDPIGTELVTIDGGTVPVMIGVVAFEPGKSSPWIAWVLDLSEHRRLEERLRQAAKAESIGLLAGGVAHDFNNLLTIIIGNVSLAEVMLPADSAVRVQLGNTLRAAERAADLTRQLLAYAGKGRFIVQPADVSAVIRDIAELFRASATKETAVRLFLADGLPLVSADATQIQQLVMNLVINGLESMGSRGGAVRVTTSVADVDEALLRSPDLVIEMLPGSYVRIEVADDGCGMDAETRPRIFDPFFTTKFTGRGLGLAAAAGIVRAHQGGMTVRSVPGEGSTFQVFLPAAAAAADTPATTGIPVSSTTKATSTAG